MTPRREPSPSPGIAEGEDTLWILHVLDASVPDVVARAQAAVGHRVPSSDPLGAGFPGSPWEPRRLGPDRAARETLRAHAERARAPADREDVEERRRRDAARSEPLRWDN